MLKFSFPVCAALVLTACSSTSQTSSGAAERYALAQELPNEFYDTPLNSAFAEELAKRCSTLRYDPAQWDRRQVALEAKMTAMGFTDAHYDAAVEYNQVSPYVRNKRAELTAKVKDPSRESSYCAAGQRERLGGTAVGKYLLPA